MRLIFTIVLLIIAKMSVQADDTKCYCTGKTVSSTHDVLNLRESTFLGKTCYCESLPWGHEVIVIPGNNELIKTSNDEYFYFKNMAKKFSSNCVFKEEYLQNLQEDQKNEIEALRSYFTYPNELRLYQLNIKGNDNCQPFQTTCEDFEYDNTIAPCGQNQCTVTANDRAHNAVIADEITDVNVGKNLTGKCKPGYVPKNPIPEGLEDTWANTCLFSQSFETSFEDLCIEDMCKADAEMYHLKKNAAVKDSYKIDCADGYQPIQKKVDCAQTNDGGSYEWINPPAFFCGMIQCATDIPNLTCTDGMCTATAGYFASYGLLNDDDHMGPNKLQQFKCSSADNAVFKVKSVETYECTFIPIPNAKFDCCNGNLCTASPSCKVTADADYEIHQKDEQDISLNTEVYDYYCTGNGTVVLDIEASKLRCPEPEGTNIVYKFTKNSCLFSGDGDQTDTTCTVACNEGFTLNANGYTSTQCQRKQTGQPKMLNPDPITLCDPIVCSFDSISGAVLDDTPGCGYTDSTLKGICWLNALNGYYLQYTATDAVTVVKTFKVMLTCLATDNLSITGVVAKQNRCYLKQSGGLRQSVLSTVATKTFINLCKDEYVVVKTPECVADSAGILSFKTPGLTAEDICQKFNCPEVSTETPEGSFSYTLRATKFFVRPGWQLVYNGNPVDGMEFECTTSKTGATFSLQMISCSRTLTAVEVKGIAPNDCISGSVLSMKSVCNMTANKGFYFLLEGEKVKKFPAKCLTKTTTTSFSTVQMQCKPFSQPHSDVFNCKNPVQDTECTQKCDVNYAFDDGKTSRTTKCTENPDDPLDMVYDALTCSLQIYCDTPSLSDDYYLTSDCSKKKNGEKCKVACSSGTFTNQADQYEMVCTATDKGGSFDAPPVCNPESVPLPNTVCPVPKIGSNSYLFGGCSGKKETETCIFRCNDGFDTPEGVSEKTITCSPNSQGTKVEFSGVPQSCREKKKCYPGKFNYGFYNNDCDDITVNLTCTYSCDKNYKVGPNTNNTVKCSDDPASMSLASLKPDPVCIPKTCPIDSTKTNIDTSLCNDVAFDNNCQVSCKNKMVSSMTGKTTDLLHCKANEDGSDEPSFGPIPKCLSYLEVPCQPPTTTLKNVTFSKCGSVKYNETCEAKCPNGKKVELTCNYGADGLSFSELKCPKDGNEMNDESSIGLIVGLAAGGFVLLVIIVVGILYWRKSLCFKEEEPQNNYGENDNKPTTDENKNEYKGYGEKENEINENLENEQIEKSNKKLDEDATEALGEVDVNQDIDNQNDEMPAFPAEDNEENGLGDEDADVDSGEINETIQLV